MNWPELGDQKLVKNIEFVKFKCSDFVKSLENTEEQLVIEDRLSLDRKDNLILNLICNNVCFLSNYL